MVMEKVILTAVMAMMAVMMGVVVCMVRVAKCDYVDGEECATTIGPGRARWGTMVPKMSTTIVSHDRIKYVALRALKAPLSKRP
jgi:hypothetical protein